MSKYRHRNIARRNNGYLSAYLLICSIALASGCTTTTTQSFDVTPNSTTDASAVAKGADFSKYDKLYADEMGIFFPTHVPLTDEDTQRIRQIFRDAFLGQLKGYTIVDAPGPTVLKVTASLVDLRNSATSDLPELRFGIRQMAKPGSLLFLMELSDSQTNEVLGRAADNSEKTDPDAMPAFATSESVATDWSTVEDAAQHWARLFRSFLDANLKP
jgi:hypothetical protein